MNRKWLKTLVGLSVAVIVVIIQYFYWAPRIMERIRVQSHISGLGYTRPRDLHLRISQFSIEESGTFKTAFGNHWAGVVSNLPPVVLTNLLGDIVEEHLDRDGWGNPLNLDITCISNAPGSKFYEVKIWSNGRNGLNEYGKGDDIFVAWPRLDVIDK